MATPSPAFNPMATTNFAGGFEVQSYGGVQGVAMDDPAVRYALANGILASTETIPMFGGVGIYADLSASAELGPNVGRATTLTKTSATGLVGFSCFNQGHAGLTWPQSPVPTWGSGMTVPYFPLGSGARIWVQANPGLSSLVGGSIAPNVSWDFNDQLLQEYVASGATESVTSLTWSATNGGQVAVVMAGASVYTLGDTINVSGVTNTGTGALALLNTNHVINTWTDSTHFTFLLPGTSTLWGTLAGTIVLNVGVGALACTILRIQSGNSKTVVWDPINQVATWNNSGTAALIQI